MTLATFILTKPFLAYAQGTVLIDVPLLLARSLECNRCGDCCDGSRESVRKDEATGLPLWVWGSAYPDDLYEARFGQRLLLPLVIGDGGVEVGHSFEQDADGKPYTAFRCTFLREWPEGQGGPETACALYGKDKNPKDLSTIRPYNCGSFPVMGLEVDDAIINSGFFIPPTGALPRCSWHGIRVTGPWKDTPSWRERFERQEQGAEVEDLSLKGVRRGE